eukprot:TRINITY_DN1591_c0_g1_i1.p1 TRINITY_DN1591_c0_g1~~TRINITY_DN1591_c0_g1_i1.p1  ORF type:complete len:3401 (-),score=659.74 TRINITY_DN1591_c0_g1_i1:53-10255(-)
MIRTGYGPVGLRRPRDSEKMTPTVGDKQPVTIFKDWLARKDAKGKKEVTKDEVYRTKVKQAMLIGARKVEQNDLATGTSVDERTGLRRSPQQIQEMESVVQKKLEALRRGTGAVPIRQHAHSTSLKKTGKVLTRHLMVKTSKWPWAWYKYRYFTIEAGIMRVYRTDEETHVGEKHRLYDIREATCKFESKEMVGLAEPFIPNYQARVRLQLKERDWGPVFLYAKEATEARSWERAIRMSKYLLNAADREALAFVVGRVSGSIMAKGWDALMRYYKEMEDTRKLMRGLAMRFMKLDISRGWNKIRLVYNQNTQREKLRKEQQDMAARFLQEKMERLSSQTAKSSKLVRLSTINKLQTLFRHYRQDMIFDRAYPLGTNVNTRVQQMQTGSTMMAAFNSLNAQDILLLTLQGDGLSEFRKDPAFFAATSSDYSEVKVNLCKVGLNVSESLTMLSFAEMDEDADASVLSKAGWGHFVNLSQISSVVIHSERVLGKGNKGPSLPYSTCGGVWFTICGPRVCWGRHARTVTDPETKAAKQEVVGAQDGIGLGTALAKGEKVQYFRLEVGVDHASVPDLHNALAEEGQIIIGDDKTDALRSRGSGQHETFLVLSFLGRQFRSERATGGTPAYSGKFIAEVPLPAGDQALAALDEAEIGIDIMEGGDDPDSHRVMWATKLPFWKLFTDAHDSFVTKASGIGGTALSTLGFQGDTLNTLGLTEEVKPRIDSMADKMQGRTLQHTKRGVKLIHPPLQGLEILPRVATLDLSVLAQIQEVPKVKGCISPELIGRGAITNLFTSHRGAWLDPSSREKKGHVPSVVELNIKELTFPADDKVQNSSTIQYRVEASCNGVKASSRALHRAKETWNHVIPCDPSKIDFKGGRLFVPLPPGCWSSPEQNPKIEVKVFRSMVTVAPTYSYNEIKAKNGKEGPPAPITELVYHAELFVDGMYLDRTRNDAVIYCSKASAAATQVGVAKGEMSTAESPAMCTMDITLRDRDFARLHAAQEHVGVICVGDKAMIKAEEPISYPQTEAEFRRRAFPGVYDANQRGGAGGAAGSASSAELRDPSLSHEYRASGLEKLDPPVPFKQRYLSDNSEDILPYKFVLPSSEAEFIAQAKPGSFWRIVEELVQKNVAASPGKVEGHKPQVVDKLSHVMKHVPVTVLAVYPDGTCDVEIAQNFLADWEKSPQRQFSIPGSVIIGEHIDTSAAAIRSAPVGAGDVGERLRRRVILKGVSLNLVNSVQSTSFNVYDAALVSTDEIARIHPNRIGNDYNPRFIDGVSDDMYSLGGQQGAYRLAAGPVPADANPASCTYEWTMQLNARSEAEMYHFITTLRQATRMDLCEQMKKLREFQQKSAYALNNRPYLDSEMYSSKCGYLEVILVEAKHLRPTRVQQEQDLHSWAQKKMRLDLKAAAVFRLVNGDKGELIFKGSKVQVSPTVSSNDPNWAEQPNLQGSNGWVFRSPLLEVNNMKGLYFQIELNNKTYEQMGHTEQLGVVQVPVFGGPHITARGGAPSVDLSDVNKPFNNFWIPLSRYDPKMQDLVPNACGELHIMTIWKPQQETAATRRLPKNARGWMAYNLKGVMRGMAIQDPIYQLQTSKQSYDPNLLDGEQPAKPAEQLAKHVQKLSGTVPYIQCCVRQEISAWAGFRGRLAKLQGDGPSVSLSEWRDSWAARPDKTNSDLLWQLDELLRRGVPPTDRHRVWPEITRADVAQMMYLGKHSGSMEGPENVSQAISFFHRLVENGRPHRNDAMWQLNEDLVAAAAWENPSHHAVMEKHFQRLKRAQDICIALIAFSRNFDHMETPPENVAGYKDCEAPGSNVCGIAYCESLLVLAFFLLVAQTPSDLAEKTQADKDAEDVRAFWILFALIGAPAPCSQPFRDYFGVPLEKPADNRGGSSGRSDEQLADRRGAMDDILRLNYVLVRFEPELWVHLNSLGFHLSSFYYGAFMHLFAFILPATTLFRFWDLLFGNAARTDLPKHKPARHGLIDLGFVGLQRCKEALLKCQSAREVQLCLHDFYERMYDPTQLVELIAETEYLLWDEPTHKAAETVGMAPLHQMDYERAVKHWERYFGQYRAQNSILFTLTRTVDLAGAGAPIIGGMANNNANANAAALSADSRVTTRAVMKIINAMQVQFQAEGMQRGEFGSMIRQMPAKLLQDVPDEDQSIVTQAWSFFNRVQEKLRDDYLATQQPVRAVGVPAPPKSTPEPEHLDSVSWAQSLRKCVGDAWTAQAGAIFDLFSTTFGERRISINEFFTALICVSKGTVSEKAIALFHLYAFVHAEEHQIPHIRSVSHAAGTIIERNEGKHQQDEGQLLKAPKDADIKTMALHFRVYVFAGGASGSRDLLLGEVFIPSLAPYVISGLRSENIRTFTIWGSEKKLPPGVSGGKQNNAGGADALLSEQGVRPYIGDITLDVRWMPSSKAKPEVGQLGLTLISIAFNPRSVEAPQLKNPRVTVHTYDKTGNELRLKRWDPRSTMRRMTQTLAMAPPVGEFVEFEQTMRRDPITGQLWTRMGSGDHGWNKAEEMWKWAPQWGAQYSIETQTFRREVCEKATATGSGPNIVKPNCISLRACRMLTADILVRGLHTITHRQACLIADETFSRAGAVPGVLDAIIVRGDVPAELRTSIGKAKEFFKEKGRAYVDVRRQLIMGHELQVSMNRYGLNLLPSNAPQDAASPLSLTTLQIKDPYPNESKTLWIRYCRAGDGQRFNKQLQVDANGNLRSESNEVTFDMEMDKPEGEVQMTLNKEEFVNCVLASPILSETLRQFATTDNGTRNLPKSTPIKLDVTVGDPTKEEADEDLMDTLNVRQGVLLEIWDSDLGKSDDFLGECWLENLGNIGPSMRRFVLPVQAASADPGESRPSSAKQTKFNCDGVLHVEAAWIFPAEELPSLPDGASLEERVAHETKKHTGKLKLKIIKAENLRAADKNWRRAGSDPYVCMYVKNQAFLKGEKKHEGFDEHGWHMNTLGRHEIFWQTSTKKATRSPVWEEEQEFLLKTGAFERRTHQAFHLNFSSRQTQRREDDHNLAILGQKEELRIHFAPKQDVIDKAKEAGKGGPEIGSRHGVEVFLGENMYQFKEKLALACIKEAKALQAKTPEESKRKAQFEAVAKDMSYRHVVMVFVPSQKLRELAQQGKTGLGSYEYKRLYRIEEQDPSSWQPLDPVCTFSHYSAMYSFGRNVAQRLRISDGTDNYKLKNNRLRAFKKEQQKYLEKYSELNTDKACFGYAKFKHEGDDSFEWRPVTVYRPEAMDGLSRRKYKVRYMFSPLVASAQLATAATALENSLTTEVDADLVLLAPENPKILASIHKEHQELLARSKLLKDQGKTEQQIVDTLNEELNRSWEKTVKGLKDQQLDANALPKPAPITLANVQDALRRADDTASAAAATAAAAAAPASALASSSSGSAPR